jgi:hypothetical protein
VLQLEEEQAQIPKEVCLLNSIILFLYIGNYAALYIVLKRIDNYAVTVRQIHFTEKPTKLK